jgi:hypothetical protein
MEFRMSQGKSGDLCHIVNVHPTETSALHEGVDDPVLDCLLATVAEQILHEGFRTQVGEGEAGPLDITLNELVPGPVSDRSVVPATRAQMYNMLQPACFALSNSALLWRSMSTV